MTSFKNFRKFSFLFTLLLFSTTLIFAQTHAEKIDQLLSKYQAYGQFNGSALVAYNGKLILKKGYGHANMEWKISNQANTKHRLGSITKQFTAVLILQLANQGKVDLKANVSTYIPDYPKEVGEKITVHQLLTHTAGVPNYTSFPDFFATKSRNPHTTEELVEVFSSLPLDFTPGAQFNYSNSGYVLLGVIVENVTGKTYEAALEEMIFKPLGMTNTGYDHHGQILENRAAGYEKAGSAYVNADYLDMSIPYAAGSMYSTVEDLFLWDQALYTEKVLPKKYMDLMFTPYVEAFGMHYGYGWMVGKVPLGETGKEQDIITHGGGINGFNTLISRLPKNKEVIILLNNTGGTNLDAMSKGINAILHDQPYEFPKQSVSTTVATTIMEKGIPAGLAHFEKIKDDAKYRLSESEMNSEGYRFLQNDQLDAAAAIFKLNVDAFPESFNVYDSYGEVLLLQGDKEGAIKNYKKSIELNPANQNGIDQLEKMGEKTADLVKEVAVSEETLDTYLGKYELMPGFILTITRDGKQLNAQATGQPMFPIFAKSKTEFYLKVVVAQLTFHPDENGKVDSVTLFQGGQELKGKRVE